MTPKLTADNYYAEKDLSRIVIHFARQSHIDLYYLQACYEMWYPFFKHRAHAEEGFETAIFMALADENKTPLAQIVGIIIADINKFKEHRNLE